MPGLGGLPERRARLGQPTADKGRVVVNVSSIAELRAARSAVAIEPGQRGEIRVEGPALGLFARAAGIDQIFGSHFAPIGAVVDDVTGEGFSTAVVKWHLPAHEAPAGSASMHQIIAATALFVALAGALGALGWVISKIEVLLFGTTSPQGGIAGLLLLAGLAAVALGFVSMPGRGRKHG